ncbi:uncharacterized protein LOC117168368 [Belonocnema kinseyi]|uniref:uncharacterized protein LOC117168368 n=1 Tax=Belonocnema kinseyi TaxID=2817044 RepID=UPI00143CE8E8|nr:uncharacterized protein LOC117168368 [Belonocnema kinseyi]
MSTIVETEKELNSKIKIVAKILHIKATNPFGSERVSGQFLLIGGECKKPEPKTAGLTEEQALKNCFKSNMYDITFRGPKKEFFSCAYNIHVTPFLKKRHGLKNGECVHVIKNKKTGKIHFDCYRNMNLY